jgi:hypothetical protein
LVFGHDYFPSEHKRDEEEEVNEKNAGMNSLQERSGRYQRERHNLYNDDGEEQQQSGERLASHDCFPHGADPSQMNYDTEPWGAERSAASRPTDFDSGSGPGQAILIITL